MSAICLCSQQDIAAQTIKRQLLSLFPFKEAHKTFDGSPIYQLDNLTLVTIESDSIYADHLDQQLSADLFIFASRHKSAAFKPALLTHIPGNWSGADLGGKPSTLCMASASAMKIALQTLLVERQRFGLESWACGLEVTHHGPWVEDIPVLFVEIGSTEVEWQNETAAEIIARVIVAVARNFQQDFPSVLGFGGPHYCPSFTRLCAETKYAVSHVMPKYHIDEVSEELVSHALDQTQGSIVYAALDWKGMSGGQRTRLLEVLDNCNLPARRVRDLLREEKVED